MSGFKRDHGTKLAIVEKLTLDLRDSKQVIIKINQIIDKINFLDEHINFLYERSRTQYNTLVAQASGLQNVYDEFQEFKKRFNIRENQELTIKEISSINTRLDLIEHQDNN